MQYLQLIIIIVGFAVITYFIVRPKEPEEKKDDQSMIMMQNQLKEIRQSLSSQQTEIQKTMQGQFSESAKVIRNVTERLTKLDDTNKQVIGFTEQLQSLEKILTNSKTRGALGEANLELILNNILPPQAFQMQYRFRNNESVDAIVRIKDKILPIDAKFSLTNYQRIVDEDNPERKLVLEKEFKNDLKKRIDETSKYIRPEENTLEFAFMFIPAEGIYYDLLVNEVGAVKVNTRSLIDYAFNEKRVIIVSPTTFAAYLQTVLQGLRALQIEESAKEIRQNVEKLQKHLAAYEDYHRKVGSHLGTVINAWNYGDKELKKIDKDVLKITGTPSNFEPTPLDRPKTD
ncbi:DNA recombination protein RmuC [Candidatus Falkowbacteria bacterium]|jgi:DNA recombination protein RmuC|nr:DNA recombination protein RmuC [Candidatus Falkowbacteria bacterium]MBT5502628.1 DNA recombination protein RmuC [Candidatus Falkowbacteria bacterium]MBT6574433.1 DNA recombination protein RmuC [Candidatus Falkowbacteria bacterium]MBT7348957.1 DNA recombination protein RmuC [Candidatus Falkowbacteria bacterium]MBT7500316.1 DNA recombination protein RmuC [Candidatus Falkowbacteria bacterium]